MNEESGNTIVRTGKNGFIDWVQDFCVGRWATVDSNMRTKDEIRFVSTKLVRKFPR